MSLASRKLGLTTVFVFSAVLSFAVVASAQPSGLYFTPKIGYSHLSADKGFGFFNTRSIDKASKGRVVLGLAAGYDFNSVYEVPIRAEIEYAWRGKKDWGTGFIEDVTGQARLVGQIAVVNEVGVQSLFANFYFDIHNSTPITPYIGGGLGMARIEADLLNGFMYDAVADTMTPVMRETTSTNFAWNIGAGAAWAINSNVSLDVGYRYADFGAANEDLGATVDIDITSHEVLMGLRYTF